MKVKNTTNPGVGYIDGYYFIHYEPTNTLFIYRDAASSSDAWRVPGYNTADAIRTWRLG